MPSFLSSDNLGQLAKALAAAQAEMGAARKDAVNPHFRSKYADFSAIVDASRPVLAKHGLAIVQGTSVEGAAVTVATRLMHGSGEWLESAFTMTAKDSSPQSLASVLTYGRRYGWSTLIGLAADEDDDGNKASRPEAPKQAQAVSKLPAGYADWVNDMVAVADEGTDALRKAWSQSPLPFRTLLSSTQSVLIDELKDKAAKVTAKTDVLVSELPTEKVKQ